MIYLDGSSEKLEIVLGGAKTTNDCPYFSSFYDVPRQQITDYSELPGGNKFGNTNGTTAVTLVAAPNQSVTRNVRHMSISNQDTVATVVTVRINDGSNTYILSEVSLTANQTLTYESGAGWSVL